MRFDISVDKGLKLLVLEWTGGERERSKRSTGEKKDKRKKRKRRGKGREICSPETETGICQGRKYIDRFEIFVDRMERADLMT